MDVRTLLDVERLLRAGVGVRLESGTGGADVILATDVVKELLRDKGVISVGRGR